MGLAGGFASPCPGSGVVPEAAFSMLPTLFPGSAVTLDSGTPGVCPVPLSGGRGSFAFDEWLVGPLPAPIADTGGLVVGEAPASPGRAWGKAWRLLCDCGPGSKGMLCAGRGAAASGAFPFTSFTSLILTVFTAVAASAVAAGVAAWEQAPG